MDNTTASVISWGAQRRLDFIDFRLQWEGLINRADLTEFFGISPQQASADVARYASLAPGNLGYDKSLKTYRASPGFASVSRHDAGMYLDELNAISTGAMSPVASYIGWRPECDIVQHPTRKIPASVLTRLLAAMRGRNEIQVTYQSMREAAPKRRWISPHAFGSDGRRWHVRAWCHEVRTFQDFVISRIRDMTDERASDVDSKDDHWWHEFSAIVLAPRSSLTQQQKNAVEMEYGMTGGRLRLESRKALAPYLLRQMQLEGPGQAPAARQPLMLENSDQLQDVLVMARKQQFDAFPESSPERNAP